MVFNEKLIELRKSKGWSQEELGYKLDVSRQTVSKWELGETTPEMNKLILLSDIFDISLDELIKGAQGKKQVQYYGHPHKENYEYKSKKTLFGLPLVHINLGKGMKRAKGVIAIGNVATGIISVGAMSVGVISLGALSFGLLALGGFALGGFTVGGFSIGGIALGGFALGGLTLGGVSIGIYSLGGCAIAKDIAMGGYAQGQIAVGDEVRGTIEFISHNNFKGVDPQQFRQAVNELLPKTSKWIVNLFAKMLG